MGMAQSIGEKTHTMQSTFLTLYLRSKKTNHSKCGAGLIVITHIKMHKFISKLCLKVPSNRLHACA